MKKQNIIYEYTQEKNLIIEVLKKTNFENIVIKEEKYYFSGFATKNSKIIYFLLRDVRFFKGKEFVIRIAKSYQDYRGEEHHFCEQNEEAIIKIVEKLIKDI